MENIAGDTVGIAIDNAPDGGRRVRLMTLGDLDGRTNAAKSARALIAAFTDDLGGVDRLSTAERVIVGRAAVASAMIEHIEAMWLSGRGLDVAEYTALVNVQRRLLTTVGMERRARDVTPDLARYIEARAATGTPAPPAAAPVTPLPPLPPPPG